jgi:hypothetical protein
MTLDDYLEQYERQPQRYGYFYATEQRTEQWEEVLSALHKGYLDTTPLVDYLIDECGWTGIAPKTIRNRINEEKIRIRKAKSVS